MDLAVAALWVASAVVEIGTSIYGIFANKKAREEAMAGYVAEEQVKNLYEKKKRKRILENIDIEKRALKESRDIANKSNVLTRAELYNNMNIPQVQQANDNVLTAFKYRSI